MDGAYVHGYHQRENERLLDQAGTLAGLLHRGTRYPPGSSVLEAGCGVGAQTVMLARRSPAAQFTSVDISADSITQARGKTDRAGLTNVQFRQADIFALPFAPASFDHVFVCFVLKHLSEPVSALGRLGGLLRPGGTITVIEGDHGSAFFHPDSMAARRAIQSQIRLQRLAGGDALIGRRIYPLLIEAGFARQSAANATAEAGLDAGQPAASGAGTSRQRRCAAAASIAAQTCCTLSPVLRSGAHCPSGHAASSSAA